MVYVSNLLKYKRRADLEDPSLETVWIEISLRSLNILLGCFYRSNYNISQSSFVTELQCSIEKAMDYSDNVILVGDFNIDFLNLTNSQLRDCMSLFNLTNVIKEPTRTVGTSSTLIDPILVSDACFVHDAGTIPVAHLISDHKATYVSIRTLTNLNNSYYREIWNYKNADYNKLNTLIQQYNWDLVINDNESVDEACVSFTDMFLEFCKNASLEKRLNSPQR